MNRTLYHSPVLLPLVALLTAAPALCGQSYWTAGHGDIGVALHGGSLEAHWHLDAGAEINGLPSAGGEYHPAALRIRTNSTQTAPAGAPQWLGIAEGSTVYRAGSHSFPPNLGFAASEIGPGDDWVGGGLHVRLSGWVLPAGSDFAMLSGSTVVFSTFAPATTDSYQPDAGQPDFDPVGNSFFLWADDHVHYSFFFSNPGYYELTFTWAGTHAEHGLLSLTDTFGVHVGAVPEPSLWAALLGCGAGLGTLFARRCKRACVARITA